MHNGFRKIYYECVCWEYEILSTNRVGFVLSLMGKINKKIIEIYHYLWKILFIIEKSWKLENENDKIKRFLKIFIIESLEWTPTEWKVPHIIERTANMHYAFSGHDRSFEDWKFRARLDRLHNMCRAKTHCNRDRFVAIKHGMQTPYANVVSFDLQPRNRFIMIQLYRKCTHVSLDVRHVTHVENM